MLKVGTPLNHGKYYINRFLASGGFGNTYEALNIAFGTKCAIKEFFLKGVVLRNERTGEISVAHPDNKKTFKTQKEKFTKEARRLNSLNNNHIIKVYDLFEENGTVYYVMDYIEGASLRDVQIKTNKSFTEKKSLFILYQTLDALQTVHENGLLHMDIKPANIMLDKTGKCTLIDFGASKQSTLGSSITTSTTMAYTPGFAPSEQISGASDRWGPWTDFYALGATMYNLITGINPSTLDIEEDGEQAYKFPSFISESTRRLIIWMMSPKRKERPQSVKEIKDYLKKNNIFIEHLVFCTKEEEKKIIQKNIIDSEISNTNEITSLEKPDITEKTETDNNTSKKHSENISKSKRSIKIKYLLIALFSVTFTIVCILIGRIINHRETNIINENRPKMNVIHSSKTQQNSQKQQINNNSNKTDKNQIEKNNDTQEAEERKINNNKKVKTQNSSNKNVTNNKESQKQKERMDETSSLKKNNNKKENESSIIIKESNPLKKKEKTIKNLNEQAKNPSIDKTNDVGTEKQAEIDRAWDNIDNSNNSKAKEIDDAW